MEKTFTKWKVTSRTAGESPAAQHQVDLMASSLNVSHCCVSTSKKKRSVIYGKWTECMYSVDPKLYEAYRKSEKKPSSDSRKLKQVRTTSGVC